MNQYNSLIKVNCYRREDLQVPKRAEVKRLARVADYTSLSRAKVKAVFAQHTST
jgi:hypothetical protein